MNGEDAALAISVAVADPTIDEESSWEVVVLVLMALGLGPEDATALADLSASDGRGFDPETQEGIREAVYRGWYLVKAAGRVLSGQPVTGEARHYEAHTRARQARESADGEAHALALVYGEVLGHHGIVDENTTPDCLALIGKNYRVSSPPDGLQPGGRHGFCRCWPGPPHLNAVVV